MWLTLNLKYKPNSQGFYTNYIKIIESNADKCEVELQIFTTNLECLYELYKDTMSREAFRYNLLESTDFTEIDIINNFHIVADLLYDANFIKSASGSIYTINSNPMFYNDKLKIHHYKDDEVLRRLKDTIEENISNSYNDNQADLLFLLFSSTKDLLEAKITIDKSYKFKSANSSIRRELFKDISEAISHRYAVLEKPSKLRNLIVDSFLPQYLIKNKFSLDKMKNDFKSISSSATMIHRGFARMLGIRELPLDDMLNMLGYTKERITQLLTNVRAKKFNIAFAGYGGVGTNTIYWITEMCNMSNVQGLFNKIIVVDTDELSIDNVIRMPNPFIQERINYQSDLSDYMQNNYSSRRNYRHSIAKVKTIPTNSLKALSTKTPYIEKMRLYGYAFNDTHVEKIYDWIVYGAPDINSRKEFSQVRNTPRSDLHSYADVLYKEHVKAFISATHGDNDCSLVINPEYSETEANLMVESYGIIQLNVFFFNQLKLAISFLEVLEKYTSDELSQINDEEFLNNYSIVNNQKSNKYNIAFQNITTIDTVENIERLQ